MTLNKFFAVTHALAGLWFAYRGITTDGAHSTAYLAFACASFALFHSHDIKVQLETMKR